MTSLRKTAILASSTLLLFLATTACDDAVRLEGDFGNDVADDGSADGSFDTDSTEPCGDGVCADDEFHYSCAVDCPRVGVVIPRGVADGTLSHFPDDLLTVADETTDTGRRVDFKGLLDDAIGDFYFGLARSIQQIEGIDGFGLTAGAFFELPIRADSNTIVSGAASISLDSAIIMGTVDENGVQVVPVDVEEFTDSNTLVVRPMLPLEPNSTAFVAITNRLKTIGGSSYVMDRTQFNILRGEADEAYDFIAAQHQAAAAALVEAGYIERDVDLAALTTFTTQDPIAKTTRIADYVNSQPVEIVEREPCEDKAEWRQCTVSFRAFRYMDDEDAIDDHTDGTPDSEYTLKAELFVPYQAGPSGGPPYPTAIFGHGLSGRREDGRQMAEFFAEEGIAVAVLDAPVHGEHPTASGGGSQFDIIFQLFGIETSPELQIVSRVLRDGWRQSNYDKLAFTKVLTEGLDADGDSTVDLDPDRLIYFGASLGAIQGPEFLAFTDDMIGNMLAVGGARVTDIVRQGDIFGPLVGLVLDSLGTPTETSKFYLFTQTVVDGGDPAVFAPHVLNDRLDGSDPVPLAVQMSVPDEVVSNPSNGYLIRALGVPLIGRVAYPIDLVESVTAPLDDNHSTGVTAGALQTDYLWNAGRAEFEPANHSDGPAEEEGVEYWTAFVESLLDGNAILTDPYVTLGRERPPLDMEAAATTDVSLRDLSTRTRAIAPFSAE